MTKISDLEINLEGLQEALNDINALLNDMITSNSLTVEAAREKARHCRDAVDKYTFIANRNIRLLNEQARYLLDKVRQIQEAEQNRSDEGYDIH